MRKLLIVAAALAISACGETHIASPAETYLHCADEPEVPGDPVTGVVTDEQDAQYKKDLRESGQDCRSKLNYVADWHHKAKH